MFYALCNLINKRDLMPWDVMDKTKIILQYQQESRTGLRLAAQSKGDSKIELQLRTNKK